MGSALETPSLDKLFKNLKIYMECDAFVGVVGKNNNYKLYPRINAKKKEMFIKCVKEKGGELKEEWINPSEPEGEANE